MPEFTVDMLFVGRRKVELPDRVVWMRTVGKLESDERYAFVNAQSVRALRSLEDTESPLFLNNVDPIAYMTDEEKAQTIVASQSQALYLQAEDAHYPLEQGEPTPHSTPLEVARIEKDTEDQEQAVAEARRATYGAFLEAKAEIVRKYSPDKLLTEALKAAQTLALMTVRQRAWEGYTLYAATHKDEATTEKYFPGPAAALAIADPIQERLLTDYYELDKFARDYAAGIAFLNGSPPGKALKKSSNKPQVDSKARGSGQPSAAT